MNYAAGFGMAMMTYAQIFYFCETGEAVEVKI